MTEVDATAGAGVGRGYPLVYNRTYGTLPPVPTVTGIVPTAGTTAGGTPVTVTGTGLTGTTAVTFGATNATSIVVVSDTSVTCVSPAGPAGAAVVTATTAGGTSTGGPQYTYTTPARNPVPPGRGRWRVTLHERTFTNAPVYPSTTGIVELPHARARVLTQAWDTSATFTFTVDGHSPEAAYIAEMAQDVIAWRWDENSGGDIPMFRGPVCQSQDTIDEQSHTVEFTCHDYLSLLSRRVITGTTPFTIANTTQDFVVQTVVAMANGTAGIYNLPPNLTPGSYLPLVVTLCNGDGTTRADTNAGVTRSWPPGTPIAQIIDDMAKSSGLDTAGVYQLGFDYDCLCRSDLDGWDHIRVFYPAQGVTRTSPVLVYGSTVSTVQRNVDSGTYGNYWRAIGNNATAAAGAAQLFGEAYNSDASAGAAGSSVGAWMSVDNTAAAVADQVTINAHAAGDLAINGVLVPTYTLGLAPGFYTWGAFNMGDTVPLVVQSGRLNVSTTVRVVGITYTVGDDGQEDVAVTVGRPLVTLTAMLTAANETVGALTRR
ncbi:MAG TPA: IPT/TIG domain-containing protein [Acidimicrobiales bacterium]|jgi:hypothetical protein